MSNQKPLIEEQTIQLRTEKWQDDKQRSTKYYTDNQGLNKPNLTKAHDVPEGLSISCYGTVKLLSHRNVLLSVKIKPSGLTIKQNMFTEIKFCNLNL
jgi:hypothetical protein